MAATRADRIAERARNEKWKNPPLRIEMLECINCDACLRHCPPQFGAIFNHGPDVVIIPELCSGCDKCLPACPVNCIYPFPEWEAAGVRRRSGGTKPPRSERPVRLKPRPLTYCTAMTALIPGAEPWSHIGSSAHGALVLHGFTGNPGSMRGVAEALAAAGYHVEMPLLPGHGTTVDDMLPTRWADWAGAAEAAYQRLAGRGPTRSWWSGLSMGGALTLRLGADHPEVAGLVCINPATQPQAPEVVEMLQGMVDGGTDGDPGIGSDIADPDANESAYDGTPLAPLLSLVIDGLAPLGEEYPGMRHAAAAAELAAGPRGRAGAGRLPRRATTAGRSSASRSSAATTWPRRTTTRSSSSSRTVAVRRPRHRLTRCRVCSPASPARPTGAAHRPAVDPRLRPDDRARRRRRRVAAPVAAWKPPASAPATT